MLTVNIFKEWAANYWADGGCPKSKLVIGVPSYGRSFRLSDASNHEVNDSASGGGAAGTFTRESGFLSYYEVKVLRENIRHECLPNLPEILIISAAI